MIDPPPIDDVVVDKFNGQFSTAWKRWLNVAYSSLPGGVIPGGVVPPELGGTGLTSYTVGDLIYASATTTLSRLVDVAVGHVFLSGGVGAIPHWGTVTAGNGIALNITSTDLAISNTGNLTCENGFTNTTDSTVSFVDGTRTFSIQPAVTNYEFFSGGTQYVKTTTSSVVIANTEGLHYIYFDTAGVLQETTTFSAAIITTDAFVAIVYWDVSGAKSIYFGDERHGRVMPSETHLYLHLTRHAVYQRGLALANFSVDGTGNSDANAEFSVADGIIWDEDLQHTITDGSPQDISPIAKIPMYYLTGADQWNKVNAGNFPLVYKSAGTNARADYNLFSGGVWSLAEVANNNFTLTHIFATNNISEPIIGIVGQATYGNIPSAQAGAASELAAIFGLGGLTPEYVAIASIIWQTSGTYANTPASRIRSTASGASYVDWRTSSGIGTSPAITDHNNLDGLQGGTTAEYFHLTSAEYAALSGDAADRILATQVFGA